MKYLHHSSLTLLSSTLSYASPQLNVKTRIEAYSCKDVKRERKARKKKEEKWMSELEEIEELSISPELKDPLLITPFGPLSSRSSRALHFLLTSTLNVAYPDYDFTSVRPEEFKREPGGVASVLGGLSGVLTDGGLTTAGNFVGASPRSFGSYPVGGVLGFAPPLLQQQVENGLGMGMGVSLPTSVGYFPGTNLLSPPSGSGRLGMPVSSARITHPTLHKILNDVIDLNECVVFSYIPSAEADPHADDDEESDVGDGEGLEGADGEDIDGNGGQAEFTYGGDANEDDGGMMMIMDDLDEDGSTYQHAKARRSSRFGDGLDGGDGWSSHQTSQSAQDGANAHMSGSSYDVQGHRIPASLSKDSGYGSSWGEIPVTPDVASGARGRNSGGLLWSTNYFLYCRRQRRILFISVWARKKDLPSSTHLHDLDPLPIGRSPLGTHASLPGSFAKAVELDTRAAPSLDGIALGISTGQNESISSGSSKTNPIYIGGGSSASTSTSTLGAGITIPAVSTNITPGFVPPPAHPKLRRERSESTASVHSTMSAGNERLKDFAGMTGSRQRASKRVKV